jgi:hypothetical protein
MQRVQAELLIPRRKGHKVTISAEEGVALKV